MNKRDKAINDAWKNSIFATSKFEKDLRRKNLVRDIFNEGAIAGYAAANRWTAVEDGLPDDEGTYEVSKKGVQDGNEFEFTADEWFDGDEFHDEAVYAWRPKLSEPYQLPQADEKENGKIMNKVSEIVLHDIDRYKTALEDISMLDTFTYGEPVQIARRALDDPSKRTLRSCDECGKVSQIGTTCREGGGRICFECSHKDCSDQCPDCHATDEMEALARADWEAIQREQATNR